MRQNKRYASIRGTETQRTASRLRRASVCGLQFPVSGTSRTNNVGEKREFPRVEKLASHSRLPLGCDPTNILQASRRG